MLTINAPRHYINEENIIYQIGNYAKRYDGPVLIVTGHTAFDQVKQTLTESFSYANIHYDIFYFNGYATKATIDEIVEKGKQLNARLIIGIGGGSALDTAKAAAHFLHIPIITVPTIAATCAAWSALSIIYNEAGETVDLIRLDQCPDIILVDPTILIQAPVRYLQAGIADTLVKWYEFAPYINEQTYEFAFMTSIHNSKLIMDVLNEHSIQATKDNENKKITIAYLKVVDAILALAGLVGSIQGGSYKEQLAHTIHNKLTYFHETYHTLHGEKVIFGLLVQFILEGKAQQEMEDFIHYLIELKQPVTFKQLGLTEHIEEKVKQLTQLLVAEKEITRFPATLSVETIVSAIYKANDLGEQLLGKLENPLSV